MLGYEYGLGKHGFARGWLDANPEIELEMAPVILANGKIVDVYVIPEVTITINSLFPIVKRFDHVLCGLNMSTLIGLDIVRGFPSICFFSYPLTLHSAICILCDWKGLLMLFPFASWIYFSILIGQLVAFF